MARENSRSALARAEPAARLVMLPNMKVLDRVLAGLRRRLLPSRVGADGGWAASYGGAYRSADETTRFALAEITRIAGYVGGHEALRGRSIL